MHKDGNRHRLSWEEDEPWANYDPQAVLSAIHAARGTFSSEEGEKLKAYIHRGREEGSRPADRP